MRTLFLFIGLLPLSAFSQSTIKHPLSIFNNLVNKTWEINSQWNNGPAFKQSTSIEFALDSQIVITRTKGFIDKDQSQMGNRNHGVRQYNTKTNTIEFYEFDIFGGKTEGHVFSEGKNVVYQYQYGDAYISEMWEYQNDSTYQLIIGEYEDSKWLKIYLKGILKQSN